MRDDLLQPAFAIYNSPGVYALLLGSGVSRSAEILTGWDIMKDLIKQVAAVLGETIDGDPGQWYADKFKNEAGYDRLLEHLGRTPLDRNAILRDYIEPSAADREENRKLPMPAHKAIAWLVEKGYIRVILTTNFDRLIETALQERGIVPDIISTDADIQTARPLQHSPITIIKIHGDYRDEVTKNTKGELTEYSERLKQLLHRVFSEYGLIVCGWSAEWDTALREVIDSSKPRFGNYWSWYSEPKEPTKQLIAARRALEISSISADELFSELQRMVEALEGTKQAPPLSVAIAVERTKKMLPRPEFHIELEELFIGEVERAYQLITSDEFAKRRGEIQKLDQSNFQGLWQLYFNETEILLNIAATICFYGNDILLDRIHPTLKRWAEQPKNPELIFRLFPSVLLMYSVGVSAVFRQNWKYLAVLLAGNEMKSSYSGRIEPFLRVVSDEFLGLVQGNHSYDYSGKYLHSVLKPVFQSYISSMEYDNAFDLFETLIALTYISSYRDTWMPPHAALFVSRSWNYLRRFWSIGRISGKDWTLLTSGLMGNDVTGIEANLANYVSIARSFRKGYIFGYSPDYKAIYKGEPEAED